MSIFKFYKPIACLLGSIFFATNFAFAMESMECEEPKQMCEICKKQESKATVYDHRFYTLPKKVCSIDCSINWINRVRRVWHAPGIKAFFPCEDKCVICMDKNLSENGCVIFPCGHISFCLECYKKIKGLKRKCSICRGYEDNVAGYGVTSFYYLPDNLRSKYPEIVSDTKCGKVMSWVRDILRKNYYKINFEFPNNSNELVITKTKEGQIAAMATAICVKNYYKLGLFKTMTEEDVKSLLIPPLCFGNVFCKFSKEGEVFVSLYGDPKHIFVA